MGGDYQPFAPGKPRIIGVLRARMKLVPGRKQRDHATGVQSEGGAQRRALSARSSRIALATCA